MKKLFISIIFIHLLTLNAYAHEHKDCSVYSKLNPKYLACKAKNFAKNTVNYQKKSWSEEKEKIQKLKEKISN